MTHRTVSAVFPSVAAADEAVRALAESGIERDTISILMGEAAYPGDRENIEEGTGWGAVFGALLGSVAMIPLLPAAGGLFVAGPVGAILSAAASGATGGGLIGALVGLGIPRSQAELYERRLNQGGVAVVVETETEDQARDAQTVIANVADDDTRASLVTTKPRP